MFRMLASILLGVLLLVSAPAPLQAGDEDETAAIEQAVLNYANSIYEMKPELVTASVHPRLQKVGYWPKRDGEGFDELWMTFEELQELAGKLNKDGIFDAETARREVKILDQMDKIAVVRLEAEWGVDYLELTKQDGSWMIINVVWQTYPDEFN